MQKKKRFALLMCATMACVALVGGSMAFLTFSDSDVNVMTVGNVKIEQHEYQRATNADGTYETGTVDSQTSYLLEAFEQGKALLPATDPGNHGAGNFDATTVRMSQVGSYGGAQVFANPNAQDKFVTVENTGKTDAYVRTLVAVECGTGNANLIGILARATETPETNTAPWVSNEIGKITVENNTYYLFEYVYRGASDVQRHADGILPADETTYPSLCQVYLNAETTNEDVEKLDGNGNGTLDILVLSQAVQADGFANAQTALDTAFGDVEATNAAAWFGGMEAPVAVATADELTEALAAGGSVYMTEDVQSTTTATGYGQADIQVNGGILNGNGNTLSVNGSGDYSAISTTGGTIENLAIDNGFRGIFLENVTEDVFIDNVTLGGEGVCYCINTGVNDGNYSLVVTNSTLNGWTSFAQIKSASFTNCTFGQGAHYTNEYGRLLKPYVNTTMADCNFIKGYYLDLSSLEAGCTVTFDNCTIDGVALTADVVTASSNWDDYDSNCTFFVELPSGRALADCVVFE